MKNYRVTVLALLVMFTVGAAVVGCEKAEKMLPANPVIVSDDALIAPNPTDYKITVKATVKNDGGPGEVEVKATVTQDGNTWTKTETKMMEKDETAEFALVFDEVKINAGEPTYEVEASPNIM